MTARQHFDNARSAHRKAGYPPCSMLVLGWSEYDALKLEVMQSVADFFPCERTVLSLELDKIKVPHFHYNGVLILRAHDSETLGPIFL